MPRAGREFRLPHPQPVDALEYARFTGVPTFMRLPNITEPEELDIAIVGIPFDGGTTYRPGPRFGPRGVRNQSAIIRPWNPVLHVNPFKKYRIADFGDLPVNPLSIEEPVYVTLDIDCVDPAFAPGTGTPQVGGFTSAQIVELVRALKGLSIVGADLVEVSPPFDNGDLTSLLAANLLFELLCVF